MQLPRLELTVTNAILGIEQQRATINMRQPEAEIKMEHSQPKIEIQKSKGKLTIDQTEAFADANLKHPFRSIDEWAARAKRKISQGIAEEVAEGERLMKIEGKKESIIPEIAREESEPPPREIEFGPMPSNAEQIQFHYQPSEIKIKILTEKFKLDVTPHSPEIKFTPGDLQIYLKQKLSLHIKAVGAALDQKI